MAKAKKMDRYLIATKQKWELEYVVKKMAKEGVICTEHHVKVAAKYNNNSRRLAYRELRVKFKL